MSERGADFPFFKLSHRRATVVLLAAVEKNHEIDPGPDGEKPPTGNVRHPGKIPLVHRGAQVDQGAGGEPQTGGDVHHVGSMAVGNEPVQACGVVAAPSNEFSGGLFPGSMEISPAPEKEVGPAVHVGKDIPLNILMEVPSRLVPF